jgi:formate hydrogenlyase subunit 3/multisubunit Na+/H+ antiporter MnhD subunit
VPEILIRPGVSFQMDSSVTVLIIKVMVGLYILSAFSSVFLHKNHKAANLIPNIICILASISGAAASLAHILGVSGKLDIFLMQSPVPYITLKISFDSLSAFFVLSLSVLVFCISIYSIGYMSHYYGKRNVGLFNFLFSGFIISMFMVLTSGNMVTFLISWEVMSMVSYFLVVFESDNKESPRAGTLYIVMTHMGTAFLFLAIMLLYSYTGSFEFLLYPSGMPAAVKNLIFISLLIGFGTKAGIVPLHIWLPYAHPAAPSNVSALMSGIMIKTAIYGLIRFLFDSLGIQHVWWGIAVLVLGAFSCFLGVAFALMEHNIKRLLAYHSIENIGIILIGLGTGMAAYAQGNKILCSLALMASLFHTFNHALFKGGLFLAAGSIQYSTHTKDIEELGGLVKSMPYTSVFMLCFSLAICAVVPFNGFVSEWLTYQSLFLNINSSYAAVSVITVLCAAILALSGALALACFVKLFGISFLGLPRSSHSKNAKEVPWSMRAGMGILAMLCTFLGLFPIEFLRILDRVICSISGVSMLDKLQGRFMLLYYPIQINGNSVMPVSIFLLLVCSILLIIGTARLVGGRLKVRSYGTWDCGFQSLNSRMQYTATGFSKPLRIVFRFVYRPGRELRTEEGSSPYYPGSTRYIVSTEKIFEKYLYYPLLDFMKALSKRLKFTVQTGSIHMYLLYIFVTILAFMLYNSLFH